MTTKSTASSAALSTASQPPPEAPKAPFFLDNSSWTIARDLGISPRVYTEHDATEAERSAFVAGARLLGLQGPRRLLVPQQLRTVDVLSSGRRFAAVLEPRRSAKTSSVLGWAVGRCLAEPGLLVGYTVATSAKKARAKYLSEVAGPIERRYPDRKTRPVKVGKSAGMERLDFDATGSAFLVLGPHSDDFRSEAFDVIIVDESGEASAEVTADLMQAGLPTQDTRPDPLFVAAGTAATFREGNLLWDLLQRGRAGDPRVAIIEYSAGLDLTVEDIETWELTVPLLLRSHPGVGTLTSLELLKDNYEAMQGNLMRFAAEYLSIFGTVGAQVGLVNAGKWSAADATTGIDGRPATTELPEPPAHFAMGVSVAVNQACASIVAAWRDDDGRAHVLQLDRREGTTWLHQRVAELTKRFRRVPIGHDDRGPVLAEVDTMSRMVPRPTFAKQNTRDITTAAALLIRELNTGNLIHYGQEGLTRAALTARRRDIGQAWGFGRPDFDSDITGIEAASIALRLYDETPRRRALPRMTA